MGTQIEITSSDGFKLGAYRADPAGKPKGAVIVVQEIFGVNNHIRAVADGYAADGYLAIAPQFFDRSQKNVDLGYGPADIEAGRGHSMKLDWANTMKDTQAACDLAKAAGKVAVVGYCWGGTTAWLAASQVNGVACTIAYYGGGIGQNIDKAPKAPVMCHWGEKDHAIPLETVKKVEAQYPAIPSFVYMGAGHGFNCNERGSWNADSAKTARERTLDFIKKHVG
jgi:carboxymethylenebutenolidase